MLVASHKATEVPADDFYLPVQVGRALNQVDLGFQGDDEGQNISTLNGSYCELTALYWALHNLQVDAIGLSHYRRYFRGTRPGPSGSKILGGAEAAALLERHDIVLPKPRRYVIETVESHYRHGHHGSDLDVVRRVLEDLSPWAVDGWDRVMAGRKLSLYNMFVMRNGEFQQCGDWLFSVLERAGKEIDNDDRSTYQQRTYGFLGERLLNAYVAARASHCSVGTVGVVNTEGEPKLQKALGLVKRKFGSQVGHA